MVVLGAQAVPVAWWWRSTLHYLLVWVWQEASEQELVCRALAVLVCVHWIAASLALLVMVACWQSAPEEVAERFETMGFLEAVQVQVQVQVQVLVPALAVVVVVLAVVRLALALADLEPDFRQQE
jgi:hypothetical protein